MGGGLSPYLKVWERVKEMERKFRFETVYWSLVGMDSSGKLGG